MKRIDVHVHCVPQSYREYCMQNDFAGRGYPDGMSAIPVCIDVQRHDIPQLTRVKAWDAATHIELMKELNIKRSILSISTPGTHLTPGNDDEARKLTRRVNEDLAEICSTHPQHFSFFASLPLPDVEGSLAEIDHVFSKGAIGVQILTNSHGVYPGDPRFAPVFDKLNEKGAIIFFHPTTCCINDAPVNPQPEYPSPILEFMFDSTRALMSLLFSSTLQRCPNITLISCHGGGTFPPVVERIAAGSRLLLENQMTSAQIKEILQTRFYFDLAGAPFPDQIHGLLRLVDRSRLVYGSDYPYTPAPLVKMLTERMDASDKELGAELTQNAESLLKGKL